ncbi:membrane protein insertase YidC [Candidatus Dependentiae bacterium]|nr:membrane protein insertase YidC [Candidatus Dependentiae bacterium]
MNIKEMIVPILLAFLITVGFNYYFGSTQQPQQEQAVLSGTTEVAPRPTQDMRPISTEIDFIDEQAAVVPHETIVETDYARLTFSTAGASMTRMEYKHVTGSVTKPLIAYKVSEGQRERHAFLLAFDARTPYNYDFVSLADSQDAAVVTYSYPVTAATALRKTFTVHKKNCRIDLRVELVGAALATATRFRIVMPSPSLAGLANDTVRIVANKSDDVTLYTNLKEAATLLWRIPTLFGLDDRYFVFAMVHDAAHVVQKAFLRFDAPQELSAFFETADQQQPVSLELSFYIGPKRSAAIEAVDPRLQLVMDYSYWGPIAKPLLWSLNTIYEYVHNYGLAIILLTLLIKLLLLPFSLHGQRSLSSNAEFSRKMKYLEQKYQNDKEQLSHQQSELIRQHGVGGFLGGCLPMFVNIPLFLALGKVLNTAIELYQARFLWVPDLAQKDPYYIFPLLGAVTISWSILPMLSAKPTASSRTKNIFPMIAFALIFTAFAAGLPAGLSLFMFVSALLGTLQSVVLKRYVKA